MAVCQPDGHDFGDFPYTTTATGEQLRIESSEKLWNIISEFSKDVKSVELYHLALLIASPASLYDDWAAEMISQYSYCKEFSVAAYPGSYQEQPHYWSESVNVIKTEITKAQKWQQQSA